MSEDDYTVDFQNENSFSISFSPAKAPARPVRRQSTKPAMTPLSSNTTKKTAPVRARRATTIAPGRKSSTAVGRVRRARQSMANIKSVKIEQEKELATEEARYSHIMKFAGNLEEQIKKVTRQKMAAEQEKAEVEKQVIALRRKKSALESRWKIASKRKGTFQLKQDLLKLEQEHEEMSAKYDKDIAALVQTSVVLEADRSLASEKLSEIKAEMEKMVNAGKEARATLNASLVAVKDDLEETQAALTEEMAKNMGLSSHSDTLKEKIAVLQASKEEKEQELEAQVAELTEQMKAAEEAVQEAERINDSISEEIASAKQQMETLETHMHQAHSEIKAINKELSTKESDWLDHASQLNEQIQSLEKNLAMLKEERQEMKERTEATTENISEIDEQLKDTDDILSGIQESIDSLTDTRDELLNNIKMGEVELLALEESTKERTVESEELQNTVLANNLAMDEASESIAEYTVLINELMQNTTQLTTQLQEAAEDTFSAEAELEQVRSEAAQSEANLLALEKSLDDLEVSLQTEKMELRNVKEQTQSDITRLKQENLHASESRQILIEEKSALLKEIEELEDQIESTSTEFLAVSEKHSDLQTHTTEMNSKLGQLKAQFSAEREELANKTASSRKTLGAEMEQLQQQMADLKSRIEAGEVEDAANVELIAQLKDELALTQLSYKEQFDKGVQDRTAIEERMALTHKEDRDEVDSLKEKISHVKRHTTDSTSQSRVLSVQIESAMATITRLTSQLKEIKGESSGLTERVNSMESEITELTTIIATQTELIANLNDTMEATQSSLHDTREKKRAMEIESENLQKDVASAEMRGNGNRNEIKRLQDAIHHLNAGFKAKMLSEEAQASSISLDIDHAQSQIREVEERMASTKLEFEELQKSTNEEIKQQQEELQEKIETSNNLAEDLDERRAETGALKLDLASANETLEALKANAISLREQIHSLSNESSKDAEIVEQLQEQWTHEQTETNRFKEQLSQSEERLAKYHEQLTEVEASVKTAQEEIVRINSANTDRDEAIAGFRQQSAALKQNKSTLKAERSRLQEKSRLLNLELSELTTKHTAARSETMKLLAEKDSRGIHIKTIEEEIANLHQQFNHLNNDLQRAAAEVDDGRDELVSADELFSSLTAELEETSSLIADTEEEWKVTEKELNSQRESIDALSELHTSLLASLSEAEIQNVAIHTSLEESEAELERLTFESAQLEEDFARVEQQQISTLVELESREELVASVHDELAANRKAIRERHEQILKAKKELEETKFMLQVEHELASEAEEREAIASAQLAMIQAQCEESTSSADGLEDLLGAQKEELTTLSASLSSLRKEKSAVAAETVSLQEEMAARALEQEEIEEAIAAQQLSTEESEATASSISEMKQERSQILLEKQQVFESLLAEKDTATAEAQAMETECDELAVKFEQMSHTLKQRKSDAAQQEQLTSVTTVEWKEMEERVDQLTASADSYSSQLELVKSERDRIIAEIAKTEKEVEEGEFSKNTLSGRLVLLENQISNTSVKEAEHLKELENIIQGADTLVEQAVNDWTEKLSKAVIEWAKEQEPWVKEEKRLDEKLEVVLERHAHLLEEADLFKELHEKEVADREKEKSMTTDVSRMTRAQIVHQIGISKRDFERTKALLITREAKVAELEKVVENSALATMSSVVLREQLDGREKIYRSLLKKVKNLNMHITRASSSSNESKQALTEGKKQNRIIAGLESQIQALETIRAQYSTFITALQTQAQKPPVTDPNLGPRIFKKYNKVNSALKKEVSTLNQKVTNAKVRNQTSRFKGRR